MKESFPFHLEESVAKIKHQVEEWVELIVKRWDDILEDAITLSALIL